MISPSEIIEGMMSFVEDLFSNGYIWYIIIGLVVLAFVLVKFL